MSKLENAATTLCSRIDEPLRWLLSFPDVPPGIYAKAVRALDSSKEVQSIIEKNKPEEKWKQVALPLE